MKKKLEHKSIRERDENKILHEGIVLLEKGNNCLKNKMKNRTAFTGVDTAFKRG